MEKWKKEIMEPYIGRLIEDRDERIEKVFLEMINGNQRSLMITGTAYLEELLMDCVSATMYYTQWKTFYKAHKMTLTFNFNLHLLYGQNHMSYTVFKIFLDLYDIRNKYAHNALLRNDHKASIDAKIMNLKNTLKDRINDYFPTENLNLPEEQKFLFRLMSNLALLLNSLSLSIIPNHQIPYLTLYDALPHMGMIISPDEEITDEIVNIYKNRFTNDPRFKFKPE